MNAPALRACWPLALAVALAACDSVSDTAPPSLAGTYALVAVGDAPLPSGGVTGGHLRLRIVETVPVYEAEWTTAAGREVRGGLFSVDGGAIEFTDTSGDALTTYVGRLEGERIRVTFAAAPFVFART